MTNAGKMCFKIDKDKLSTQMTRGAKSDPKLEINYEFRRRAKLQKCDKNSQNQSKLDKLK